MNYHSTISNQEKVESEKLITILTKLKHCVFVGIFNLLTIHWHILQQRHCINRYPSWITLVIEQNGKSLEASITPAFSPPTPMYPSPQTMLRRWFGSLVTTCTSTQTYQFHFISLFVFGSAVLSYYRQQQIACPLHSAIFSYPWALRSCSGFYLNCFVFGVSPFTSADFPTPPATTMHSGIKWTQNHDIEKLLI